MRHPDHQRATKAFSARQWAEVVRLLPVASLTDSEDVRMCAIALSESGRPQEGWTLIDRARRARPDDVVLATNAASILKRLDRIVEAESVLREVVIAQPGFLPAWLNLANLLRADARLDAARPCYLRVLEIDAAHVAARVALAEIDKALGDIDGAVSGFREAIRLRPTCGQAWWGIANLKTRPFDDDDRARLETLWADPGLPDIDRETLGFARASAMANRADTESAWQALMDANRFVATRRPFKRDTFLAQVTTQQSRLASLVPTDSTIGHEVVFIVGMPRSGSTLLEQMLGAHPEVAAASELPDLPILLKSRSGMRPDPVATGMAYLERTARWRTERPRHIDKWPGNVLQLCDLLAALPGARVIECRRDARDNALSCLQQYFALGHEFSYDLAALATYIGGCRAIVDQAVLRMPDQVCVVDYEQLTASPESTLRPLLDFLGLAWTDRCLSPEKVVRTVRTASAAQVREPVDQRGIGRYRQFARHFADWTENGRPENATRASDQA